MQDIKKQLVIFNQFFYPAFKAGGPVKSLNLLYKSLKNKFNIFVFTSQKDIDNKKIFFKNKKLISSNNFFFVIINSFRLLVNLNTKAIINFNSFFSFNFTILPLIIIKIFFSKKFFLIISPRGELFSETLQYKFIKKIIYIKIFKIFLSKNLIFHSTSKQEYTSIKKLFPKNKICILPNLIEKKNFSLNDKRYYSKNLKFVFFSRITKKKRLERVINILSKINHNLVLDIYGPIENHLYWKKIKYLMESKKNKIFKINYKGIIFKDIYNVIKRYNFFIFLSKSENFGHVIFEAMQSGCIPILSENMPWKIIEKKRCGVMLSENDKIAKKKLEKFLKKMNSHNYFARLKNLKKLNEKIIKENNSIMYLNFYNKL